MNSVVFTPASLLDLLSQIDELKDYEVGVTETLDGELQLTVGDSAYLIDTDNATDVSVDDSVVEQVEETNLDAYENLDDSVDVKVYDEREPVESGILKELAKSLGYAGVATSGIGISLVGAPVIGVPILVAGIVGIEQKIINASAPESSTFEGCLFKLTKKSKHRSLDQSSLFNPEEVAKMTNIFKGDSEHDQRRGKGSMMLLQTLVLLQREKMILERRANSKDDNGAYDRNYQTRTHARNVKNLEALERLGYIAIEDISEYKKKYQITERLGFGQVKDALKATKAMLIGSHEEKEKYKKQLYTVKFRLTDKNIDFDELYDAFKSQKNEDVTSTFRGLYSKEYGILAQKKLDICKDFNGMPMIGYDAKQSYTDRVDSEQSGMKSHQDYIEELHVDGNVEIRSQNEHIGNNDKSKVKQEENPQR